MSRQEFDLCGDEIVVAGIAVLVVIADDLSTDGAQLPTDEDPVYLTDVSAESRTLEAVECGSGLFVAVDLGISVVPASSDKGIDSRVAGRTVHVATEQLWVIGWVGVRVLIDNARLILPRQLAHVIEVRIDEAEFDTASSV